jgi:hypothetical protein
LIIECKGTYGKVSQKAIGKDAFKGIENIGFVIQSFQSDFVKSLEKMQITNKYIVGADINLKRYKFFASYFQEYLTRYPSPDLMVQLFGNFKAKYQNASFDQLQYILQVPDQCIDIEFH